MEFGRSFRIELFGASHGPEVGVVVSGVPAGTPVDVAALQHDLDRRRAMGRRLASRRQEPDELLIDRGVHGGLADGGPIRMHVANVDVRRGPYERLKGRPRPGHADYPALVRYGPGVDLSGGGIFSGRMTVGIVAAGGLAKTLLAARGIGIAAFTRSIGRVALRGPVPLPLAELRRRRDAHEVGVPDRERASEMERAIAAARRSGDSLGGVIECRAEGLPVGVGEPFFDPLESELAHLLFAVPAVKGVEFGDGFAVARATGRTNNDAFYWDPAGRVATRTNHAGGILGGLSTGMPLVLRVAVKPTPSVPRPQETVDLITREGATVVVTGRHDPCIVPRAVVVVEAATAVVLADLMMRGGFLP